MLKNRLSRAGFTVVVATDGAQGIAMATSEQPFEDSLLHCMSPVVALLGLREMSDLSLQSGPKRTLIRSLSPIRDFMSTRPSVMGPVMSSLPRVIVASPSSRFCPWSTLRPPHCAVRGSGEPI